MRSLTTEKRWMLASREEEGLPELVRCRVDSGGHVEINDFYTACGSCQEVVGGEDRAYPGKVACWKGKKNNQLYHRQIDVGRAPRHI